MKNKPARARIFPPVLCFLLLFVSALLVTLLCAYFLLPRNGGDQTGQSAPPPATDTVIYLDPGHGGFDFGASAQLNGGALLEKELVLSLALAAEKELSARGYTVHLSRTGDERHTYTTSAAEVYARLSDAEEKGATLLISLHANAYAGEGRAYGARVYYDPATSTGERAARRFAEGIDEATGGLSLRACRTVPDGSYAILAGRSMTALLFECGFLSDGAECALLASDAYRACLSAGIVAGVERILAKQ